MHQLKVCMNINVYQNIRRLLSFRKSLFVPTLIWHHTVLVILKNTITMCSLWHNIQDGFIIRYFLNTFYQQSNFSWFQELHHDNIKCSICVSFLNYIHVTDLSPTQRVNDTNKPMENGIGKISIKYETGNIKSYYTIIQDMSEVTEPYKAYVTNLK